MANAVKKRKRKLKFNRRKQKHGQSIVILASLLCLVLNMASTSAQKTSSTTAVLNGNAVKKYSGFNFEKSNNTTTASNYIAYKSTQSVFVPIKKIRTNYEKKTRQKSSYKNNNIQMYSTNTNSTRPRGYKSRRRKVFLPVSLQTISNTHDPSHEAEISYSIEPSKTDLDPALKINSHISQSQNQFSFSRSGGYFQDQYQYQAQQLPKYISQQNNRNTTKTMRINARPDFQQQQISSVTSDIQKKQHRKIFYDSIKQQNTKPPSRALEQGIADFVVYRNIGVVPCPPSVRLIPHRFISVGGDNIPKTELHKQSNQWWKECHCNPAGSTSNNCEKDSGQCPCFPNVIGRRCEKCNTGHWNLTEGIGCFDCSCDPVGSRSKLCNPWTGQCDCKVGVSGQRCNECTDGFYGLSIDGCHRCAQCLSEGQICDPINGRCICPENSRGPGCSQCVAGFWRWQERVGCRKCACDHIGSIGHICMPSTGQCQCREGYAGRQCDICAVGYFGYPECRRCNCDPNGAFVRQDGLIACDDNGQCPCKSLVIGLKCDTCMQASFGLSINNPEGCTRCFCFGRSTECEQSEWSWGHIRMAEARNLSVQYIRPQRTSTAEYEYIVVIQMTGARSYREDAEINLINDISLIPKSTGNVSIGAYGNFYYPLYFQLPPQFYGDRTNSYGGYLYFTLITEGAERPLELKVLRRFPLIQLHAQTKLVLDFFEFEGHEYSLNKTYKVPLHESYWKHHSNGLNVERATLMIALQNVRHIFLRGSTFSDFAQVVLQNVHMDSAIYIQGSTNVLAKGVEHCKCPKRYNGLSCQDPGRGFFRWRNFTESETIFIEGLVGRAMPCQCNGRSNECDRETGICNDCLENTGGDHCERCAEGFYGDPDSSHRCQPCPCPETSRNFAKGCTVWQEEVSCICKPGHSGKLCESCESGYWKSLIINENGICQPCNCNLDGIRTEGCDVVTGQCYCREGVTGIKCDKCILERTHLRDHNCQICDNCSLLLLDYIEEIVIRFRNGTQNIDLQGIPPPYLKVEEYKNSFLKFNIGYHDSMNAREIVTNYDNNGLLKLDTHAENNKFQWRKLLSTASKRKDAVLIIKEDATVLHMSLGKHLADILQTILYLNNYERSERYLSLSTVLVQAQFYVDSIRQHDESIVKMRDTLQCAWKYFYIFGNTSDEAFDRQTDVDIFWRDLNQSNFRISDLRLQTDRTLEIQGEIADLLEHSVNLKNYLSESFNKIKDLSNDLYQKLHPSYILKIEDILKEVTVNQNQILSHLKFINNKSTILNVTLTEQKDIHREVKKHWLPKAQKHASRLNERSNEYARQFQPTKNGARIAVLASSVHKNISDAIASAKQISVEVTDRTLKTQHTIFLPSGGNSVMDRAELSLQKSNMLQNLALQEMQKATALKERLKIYEDMVQNIKLRIFDAGVRANNVFANLLTQVSVTQAQKLALESRNVGQHIIEDMRAETRKVKDLHESFKKLRQKFDILDPDWEIKLGMAEENISLTKTNIRLANISLTNLGQQSKNTEPHFSKWNQTMFKELQEIQNKIAMARHAAEGIKVSLESSSGLKCIRSYLPTNYGLSTFNNLKLSFALSSRNGNSPLVYIQGTESRFISIDLYKRNVRLMWCLGGSTVTVTHPLEVQTRDPKYDDAWYHVEANRTLNTGTLLVRRMNNYGSLVPSVAVSSYSDPEHTRFFQNSKERIYLGGYPPHAPENELRKNAGLNVVVHKLEVDNQHIGTWNFITTEGMCGGAMVGAQESSSSSVARYFNGLGYAELKKTRLRPYRKNLFALQMTFKTLDENALLFLAVDDKNNRSVSVTLSRGRIMFRIDYGNDFKLEINTTERYNTRRWIKIEAAREFVPKRGTENGILRVNNDRPLTGSPSVPISSHLLPDLSKPIYYLGGVPPGFKSGTSKAPGADNPFLGCMRDVQVNGETYDPLESSAVYGVEPSCKEIITRAGFTGNGFIELLNQSLRKRANVGFVFRTLQPNCLLLLSAYPPDVAQDYDDKDIRGNYSVSLVNGHMQVWINSGRSELKMHSNLSLNDGEFHVFKLIKNGRRFELMIDDVMQDVQSLSASPTLVALPRDAGGLYIGGVPSYAEQALLAPTFAKLEGAVRDVIINNNTINFNYALAFTNVQIGRGGPLVDGSGNTINMVLNTAPMIGKSFTASPEGCLRVWADFKVHTKEKLRKNKLSIGGTGGGPSKFTPLSPLEEEAVKLLDLECTVNGASDALRFGGSTSSTSRNNEGTSAECTLNVVLEDSAVDVAMGETEDITNEGPQIYERTPRKRSRTLAASSCDKENLLQKQVKNQIIFQKQNIDILTAINENLKIINRYKRKEYELKEKEYKLKEKKELELATQRFEFVKGNELDKKLLKKQKLELKQKALEIEEEKMKML